MPGCHESVTAVISTACNHRDTIAVNAGEQSSSGLEDVPARILHELDARHAEFLDGTPIELAHLLGRGNFSRSKRYRAFE
jgi:hypothetical protein